MAFAYGGVWVMVCIFPAHQVGGLAELWDKYYRLWVFTGMGYNNVPIYPRQGGTLPVCLRETK